MILCSHHVFPVSGTNNTYWLINRRNGPTIIGRWINATPLSFRVTSHVTKECFPWPKLLATLGTRSCDLRCRRVRFIVIFWPRYCIRRKQTWFNLDQPSPFFTWVLMVECGRDWRRWWKAEIRVGISIMACHHCLRSKAYGNWTRKKNKRKKNVTTGEEVAYVDVMAVIGS